MNKQLQNLSSYQQIRNKVEKDLKIGKRRFKLIELEYLFKISHTKMVGIVYSMEEVRVNARLRPFVRYFSQNKKGRPVLSEFEIPKNDNRGVALMTGEEIRSKRLIENKISRYNNKYEAAEEDMKKFNFQLE